MSSSYHPTLDGRDARAPEPAPLESDEPTERIPAATLPRRRPGLRSGTFAPGTRIDERYTVEAPVGVGGTAHVVRVVDLATGRRLALKYIPRADESRAPRLPSFSVRLEHEFHTLARLRHPGIVRAFDFGIAVGMPYYTMEYLAGGDLSARAGSDPLVVCRWLRQIASALAFLHLRGLVHRDVTAANVRLSAGGDAKLIDFGIMTSSGLVAGVSGTPPYVAPETMRRQPVDHRADLYSLGALAYLLLTGQHAVAVSDLDQVERAWKRPVLPPSRLAPDLPPQLESLVLSLLSVDPLARPRSAAEVIARLDAICGDSHSEPAEVLPSILASTTLVGRRTELQQFRDRLASKAPLGLSWLIEAPAGFGKTRLLRELELEAQLGGYAVVHVDCTSRAGPHGTLRRLAQGLLRRTPSVAASAAVTEADVLGRVVPELAASGEAVPTRRGVGLEDRLRVNDAVLHWIRRIGWARPTALFIDNLHRADEASAAVLSALACSETLSGVRKAGSPSLVIVAAQKTGARVVAPDAVAALGSHSTRIRLAGLGPEDTEMFLETTLGRVPGLARLARFVFEATAGIPLHMVELLRHLIQSGTIAYADGVWCLPPILETEHPTWSLSRAVHERLASCSRVARALTQLLAAYDATASVDLCAALVPSVSPEDLFGALDELQDMGILLRSEEGYALPHDSLRDEILAAVGPEGRQELHRVVGLALGDRPAGARSAELGWHLLKGGETLRAADELSGVGRLMRRRMAFADAVAPLEAALNVYEAAGEDIGKTLRMRTELVWCAANSTPQVMRRYAPDTLGALRERGGLDLVDRCRRVMPASLALVAGIGAAHVRALFSSRLSGEPAPHESLRSWLFLCVSVAAAYAGMNRLHELREIAAQLEPFDAHRGVARAVYLMVQALADFVGGEYGSAYSRAGEAARFGYRFPKQIPRTYRGMGRGMCHALRALCVVPWQYPGAELDALDHLGLRYFELSRLQIAVGYRRHRGEEETARELEVRAEIEALKLGTVWHLTSWLTQHSSLAYALIGDVVGLRESLERLERLVEVGFNYRSELRILRADFDRERGAPARALAALEKMFSADEVEPHHREWAYLAAARCQVMLGNSRAARGDALSVLQEGQRVGRRRRHLELRALALLAVAEAQLGHRVEAEQALRRAMEEGLPLASPSISAAILAAGAEVARCRSDHAERLRFTAQLGEVVRPTKNPALVAWVHRVA